MSPSTLDKAVVLSRTNFGETDRIMTVLSENNGKIKIIAKGVRKPKSKLAGGIELFAENELVFVENSRSELKLLTSSRMKRYFGDIVKDFDASMYAYEALKLTNKVLPEGQGQEYYPWLIKLFLALQAKKVPLAQIKIWFGLKFLQLSGSQPNLSTDPSGHKLAGEKFAFDFDKQCFYPSKDGQFTQQDIKLLRLHAGSKNPVTINTKAVGNDNAASWLLDTIIREVAA